jgi:hypothetical protein
MLSYTTSSTLTKQPDPSCHISLWCIRSLVQHLILSASPVRSRFGTRATSEAFERIRSLARAQDVGEAFYYHFGLSFSLICLMCRCCSWIKRRKDHGKAAWCRGMCRQGRQRWWWWWCLVQDAGSNPNTPQVRKHGKVRNYETESVDQEPQSSLYK